MKVFLTGATGFVGSHVARELAGRGAELRLLVRKSSRTDNLEGIAGETVIGDLRHFRRFIRPPQPFERGQPMR